MHMRRDIKKIMPEHYIAIPTPTGTMEVDLRAQDFYDWAFSHLESHEASQVIDLKQDGKDDEAKDLLAEFVTRVYEK